MKLNDKVVQNTLYIVTVAFCAIQQIDYNLRDVQLSLCGFGHQVSVTYPILCQTETVGTISNNEHLFKTQQRTSPIQIINESNPISFRELTLFHSLRILFKLQYKRNRINKTNSSLSYSNSWSEFNLGSEITSWDRTYRWDPWRPKRLGTEQESVYSVHNSPGYRLAFHGFESRLQKTNAILE